MWTSTTGSGGLDFLSVLPKKNNQAAYAHTYVYSNYGGAAVSWVRHTHSMKVIVNGQMVYKSHGTLSLNSGWPCRIQFPLNKGWNSVLFKVTYADDRTWGFVSKLWPAQGYEDEQQNIAWTTALPWSTTSSPIIVGEKLFTTAEPCRIICMDKKDGKVQWLHTLTFLDTLTPEVKVAQADFVSKVSR